MSNFILLVQNRTKSPQNTIRWKSAKLKILQHSDSPICPILSKHRSSKQNHTEFYDGEGEVDEVVKAGQNVQNLT